MQIEKFIGFAGAGNMAEALIRGLLKGKHFAPESIGASGPRQERMQELHERFGIFTTTDNRELAAKSEILILSIKPQIMRRVLDEISDSVRENTLVISIAAGVPTAAIEKRLHSSVRVVRAMPNTPAVVDAGATAIS